MPTERLATTSLGEGPPLVLLHGFTQTRGSWASLTDRLGGRYRITAVDAPGHGDSAAITADLPRSGVLVVDAGGPATYVGYSMGARIALHAALAHPRQVERLVLVSGTAGIDDDAERAERRTADEALADSIERDGVDAFLTRWLALPMFAGLPERAHGLPDRRRNTAAGLASSLRLAGTGTQVPLWDRLGELTMPVLLVTGEADAKFTALAERMADRLPHAELTAVAGAGHTVHLEQPDTFHDVLDAWLHRTA